MTQTLPTTDRPGATAPDDLRLAIPGTTVRGRTARVLPADRPDTTSWAPQDAGRPAESPADSPPHAATAAR
ncbi:acyl-CoA desaturase, partial [Micrococcus luteus]